MANQTEAKQDVPIRTKGQEMQRTSHMSMSMLRPREEIDRLFDRFIGRGWLLPWAVERSPWSELMAPLSDMRIPGIDVIDRDDEILVRAEVPGVDKNDLDISIANHTLTIKGSISREEKEERGDYYRCEISSGGFVRNVELPANVDASKVNATLKNGILEIQLPKEEGAKRQSIPIK
ncbi:MAG TPA: Hsp20/alpha crystallin family protein [Burkholderiales bacterium]|nr:Hsp20/alpha crystallin family protein [Burkholderiales bacterium]